MLVVIDSNEELTKHLRLNQTQLSVVLYTGRWSDPCKAIVKTFKRLASVYENKMQFIMVDVDVLDELVYKMNVNVVPTFHVFAKNGTLVDQLIGCNEEKLEKLIEKLDKPAATAIHS